MYLGHASDLAKPRLISCEHDETAITKRDKDTVAESHAIYD